MSSISTTTGGQLSYSNIKTIPYKSTNPNNYLVSLRKTNNSFKFSRKIHSLSSKAKSWRSSWRIWKRIMSKLLENISYSMMSLKIWKKKWIIYIKRIKNCRIKIIGSIKKIKLLSKGMFGLRKKYFTRRGNKRR